MKDLSELREQFRDKTVRPGTLAYALGLDWPDAVGVINGLALEDAARLADAASQTAIAGSDQLLRAEMLRMSIVRDDNAPMTVAADRRPALPSMIKTMKHG